MPHRATALRSRLGIAVVAAVLGACVAVAGLARAADAPAAARPEQGTRWQELKPAQQIALRPLEQQWPRLDGNSKQKWIALSSRYSKLSPPAQARVQERMTQWAKLTPIERGQARLHFQEAKELPPQDRQARWQAYQALSPEQKRELAARAAPGAADAARRQPPGQPSPMRDAPQAKSNVVPNPNFSAPPRAIAPTVLQSRSGATTTSVTRRPMPPAHQQAGMPKIAATPGFVNKATLLPQRGPQGAATRSAAAPADEPTPRQ